MGIGGLKYGQIVNTIFLKVAVSDILTLFSARTAHQFFFQKVPHPILLVCTFIALCISTTLATAWPCGTLDEVPVCGLGYNGGKMSIWIWIYCIIVFFIQDAVKVAAWRLIMYFNIMNVNNEVHAKHVVEVDEEEMTETKTSEHPASDHHTSEHHEETKHSSH